VIDKLIPLVRPEPWTEHAACGGMDPNIFHPERGDTRAVRRALAVCAACPVAADCLDYALRIGSTVGILGGTSGKQRRGMLAGGKRGLRDIPCGTYAGWRKHKREGSEACFACCEAMRSFSRQAGARRRAQRGAA